MAELKSWAQRSIGSLLQSMQTSPDDVEEIVDHMLTFQDPDELRDFLSAFLEGHEQRITNFVSELFDRKGVSAGKGGKDSKDSKDNKGRGKGKDKSKRGHDDDGDSRRRRKEDDFPRMKMPTLAKDELDKRIMVIDAASGRHNILTNCMNCGKVIAESEGWGPCLFCGNPLELGDSVGVRCGDDRGYMESRGPSGEREQDKYNAQFEKAKALKDRLLGYDRNNQKMTQVYDDAVDWYTDANNAWLSGQQRADAIRQAEEEEQRIKDSKSKVHVQLDLVNRKVIDNAPQVNAALAKKNKENFEAWNDKVVQENKLLAMFESNMQGMGGHRSGLSADSQQLYDKLRASLHETGKRLDKDAKSKWAAPGADDENITAERKNARWDASVDKNRVENDFTGVSMSTFHSAGGDQAQLLPIEESPYGDDDDKGQCLSMHQPWASLLVYGFKRAEGRNWKHDHRGRLWIHAAAKVPEDYQIEEVEMQYRWLYESQGIPMPKMPSETGGYPTSVLLGCVDMEECFSNADFKALLQSNPSLPPEQNDNEFIFWCLRPRRLVVPLKMSGDNKVWRLPVASMRTAQRGLQPMRWPIPGTVQTAPCLASPPHRTSVRKPPASSDPPKEVLAQKPVEEQPSATAKASASSATVKAAQRARVPSPRESAAPHLDLWPAANPQEEILEVVGRERGTADRDVVVLQDGFVHLVGFIPQDIQQQVVDAMREIGISDRGFFAEQFDGIKVSKDVSRMYLGMHWNNQTHRWDTTRSMDGEPVAAIPNFLLDMYSEAVKRANRELTRGPNKKRKLQPFPEGAAPTIGVVNFFQTSGTMQIHQDRSESKESICAGHPVMGICIGASCDFPYGIEQPTKAQKPKTVRLESGDVYLFGGASRMLWHGVSKILPRSAPPSLRLLPGRLNVTLRVH